MSTPPPSTVTDSSPLGSLAGGDGGVGGEAMRSRIAGRLFGQEAAPVRIGRFELAEQLGVGGMGVVHRAYDPKLGRDVAVKVLHGDRVSARERERMLREAQALAKLNHPNVVQVYEVGEHDDQVFIAMEYVAGRSAKQWQEGGKRPWREVLDVYLQAGEGLAAAHAAGIVHRDFKPANVLIGDDGRVRVADFGLARGRDAGSSESDSGPGRSASRTLGSSDPITKTGAVLGTPAYMAPEQFMGEPADERSDQFSFCVSLWEGLTGERPYSVAQLRDGPPAQSLWRRQGAPRRLFSIVGSGLSFSPALRAPNMRRLLTRLAQPIPTAKIRLGIPITLMTACGLGVVLVDRAPADTRCRSLMHRVAEDWSETRRVDIAQNLRHSAPYAVPVLQSLEDRIDGYYAEWYRAATDTCHDHGGGDNERAYSCLEQASYQGRAAIELLASATTDNATKVHSVVEGLDSPSRCSMRESGSVEPPPVPLDQGRIQTTTALRARIDRTSLYLRAARYEEALKSAHALLEDARELAFPPVSAEAHLVVGRLEDLTGSPRNALALYDRAVEFAQQAGYDEFVVAGLCAGAKLAANRLENVELARRYLGLAAATAERTRLPPLRRREVDEATLSVRLAGNELQEALLLADSLARRADEEGGSSDSRTGATRVMADLYVRGGKRQEAAELYARLLDEQAATLGPRHPELASTELSMGLALQNEPSDSLPHLERALAIAEQAFGRDSDRNARYLTAAALANLRSGNLATAEALASRAWEMQSRWHYDRDERGSALAILVELDLSRGDDERLIEHLQTLVRDWDTPAHESRLAQATNRLAWHLCRIGQCSEARPHYTRLRDITTPGQALRRFAELGLVHVEIAEEHYDAALSLLEPLQRERDAGVADLGTDYLTELLLFEGVARIGRSPRDREAEQILMRIRPSLAVRGQDWAVTMIDQTISRSTD